MVEKMSFQLDTITMNEKEVYEAIKNHSLYLFVIVIMIVILN